MNLYDCHEHDTFDEYHTGLRQLFEVIRYNKDKEQLQRIMEESKEVYGNIDSETREMFEVMAGVKLSEEHGATENGKERYNMIKAFEDMKEDGRREGKIEGRIESIMELLEEFGQVPQRIVELIRAEDNLGVLSRWHKSAAKAASIAEFEANM